MSEPLSDALLADYLEGLLEPGEAARVEAACAPGSAAAARLEALRELLAEPVELPAVDLPANLEAWTLARLDEELEVQARLEAELFAEPVQLPELAPPPDLQARVLACLEEEGLVQADPAAEDLLAEPVQLPQLAAPPGLDALVLARLEEEGLVQEAPAEQAPPGLLDATLSRLEQEGLMQPAAPRGRVLRFPALLTPWLAAAALVLAAGLGLLLGRASTGGQTERLATLDRRLAELEAERGAASNDPEQIAELERALDASRRRLERLEGERGGLEQAAQAARHQAQELAGRVEAGHAERTRLQQALQEASQRSGQLSQELAALREQAPDPELASLRGELAQRQQALEELQATQHQAQARIAELEQLAQARPASPAAMQVSDASGVDLWDFVSGRWVRLQGAQGLPPGSVLRGYGDRSKVQLADLGFPLDLRAGLYVVTHSGRLEPLPDPARARATAVARRPPSLEDGVRELIAAVGSGNPTARSRAQANLTALYQRLGDPSPAMVALVQGSGVPANVDVQGPPSTPEGWEAWWERVRDTVR